MRGCGRGWVVLPDSRQPTWMPLQPLLGVPAGREAEPVGGTVLEATLAQGT
jgi:hypothetical protein